MTITVSLIILLLYRWLKINLRFETSFSVPGVHQITPPTVNKAVNSKSHSPVCTTMCLVPRIANLHSNLLNEVVNISAWKIPRNII